MVWAIKHHSIGHTFFDEGAATFFLPHLVAETSSGEEAEGAEEGVEPVLEVSPLKRPKYVQDKESLWLDRERGATVEGVVGGALGPDWHSDLKMTGMGQNEVI